MLEGLFSRGAFMDESCRKDVFNGGAFKDKSCGKDLFRRGGALED